ncbi:hypothetical protein SAMN05444004_101245 [Jannaschia faecimaris]|uniref:Uncharacterized protein n=1 Tax=Jannaschia faecimaris TaxID=1244108 RepID=A0A1H3J8X9_9RHOB|nr:hypothetical protein [Jannaschia faecimaris]SDY36362.1 hypothetical protein SAMN05444004_101245 [Jannaschia faecimaris]
MIRTLARQTWLHVAAGAALMGGWAAFANRGHPTSEMVQAAVVQGLMSGLLTAVLKIVADHLLRILPHWTLAAGIALLISGTMLVKVHLMAGTPELGATVVVPLLVSGSYVFLYCFLRQRGPHG